MNKSQLTDAVAERLGSKKDAAAALEALVDTITTAVADGEKVTIPGFGSWERVQRPARDARNPATGGVVKVPATNVPKFKVGANFRAAVKSRSAA